jgi:hypothetical protein
MGNPNKRVAPSPVPSAPPKLAPLAFSKPVPLSSPPPVVSVDGKPPTKHLFDSEPFKTYERFQFIYNANSTQEDHLDQTMPPQLDPQPISRPSKLRAETPAFVPQDQQLRTSITLDAGSEGDEMVRSLFPAPVDHWLPDDEIRDHIQLIESMAPTAQNWKMDESCNDFNTLPGHGSYRSLSNHPESRPVPRPRFYYKRANQSRKDIIITAEGAIRNAIKIVERFLPNGTPYHDYWPTFEKSDYDFISEFESMSTDEKIEMLKDKEVEVIVMLKTNDDEEILIKKKKNKAKKSKYKDKESGGFMAAGDISGGNMEKKEQGAAEGGGYSDARFTEQNAKHTKEDQTLGTSYGDAEVEGVKVFGTENAKTTTVIDTLNALGPDFAKYTTSLWVTLDFAGITSPMGSVPAIPTGPRATAWIDPKQPIKFGTNFVFITELVGALQVFTELKHMRINLRVRESATGFPFTLQQLALVLPFYDFSFIDWNVSYQDEVFTATVPVRDNEFPMKWLDRKRDKILRAREKGSLRKKRNPDGQASLADFLKESRK